MVLSNLLSEVLRPKKIDDMILIKRIEDALGDTNNINQHLLFVGSPGLGKTTLAKILAKDTVNLYINCSLDRGIETVRQQITDFCSTGSLIESKSQYKIIIADEIDGVSNDFFKALRATMEQWHMNARFIATCNYKEKIPEPILSRFLVINFNPEDEAEENEMIKLYAKKVIGVTNQLKMEWENKEVLLGFVKKHFPDLRRIFNQIQHFNTSKIQKITSTVISKDIYSFQDIYKMMISAPNAVENYKRIMSKYNGKEDEILRAVGNDFPNWLETNYKAKYDKIPQVLIACAEWEYKKNFMIDKILAILALVFQSQQIFNN